MEERKVGGKKMSDYNARCNLPHEETNRFKVYSGQINETIPRLLFDRRTFMSVADHVQRRMEVRREEISSFYLGHCFFTSDFLVNTREGKKVKVVLDLDEKNLQKINPKKRLVCGTGILLDDGVYDSIPGFEIKKEEIGKIDEPLSRMEAKTHFIWRILLRHPGFVPKEKAVPGLLEEAVDFFFSKGKEDFGYEEAMTVRLGYSLKYRSTKSSEMLNPWAIYGSKGGCTVDSRSGFNYGQGLIVGEK
ncbi:MAG: hypothetical protein Q8P57_00635 [Candidatus Pacearchaeota archaeon]|nr:hypothetical protein [Candidatus Pacearchaeota archaeon]